MKKIISGNKYDFKVILTRKQRGSLFEIQSLYKMDKSLSTITNVNVIISELLEPILKTNEFQDSTIIVDFKNGQKLFNTAVEFFNDKNWIGFLEGELDEDRREGGWNSDFLF